MSGHDLHRYEGTLPKKPPQLKLPVPFIPTTRKVTREDRERVTQYTPFSELPAVLYPKLSNSYKAPIMHCGWTMERLWKYTEDNGFAVRPIIDYRDFLTEEEEDEYGDEDEDEDLIDDDSPEVGLLDPEECMKNALAHLVDKLDIKEILATTATEMIVANPHNGFLSLYTNYSVRRAPSPEAIEKLRVALGEEEGPKWYLDAFHWYWKPRPASAIRAKPLRMVDRRKSVYPTPPTDFPYHHPIDLNDALHFTFRALYVLSEVQIREYSHALKIGSQQPYDGQE